MKVSVKGTRINFVCATGKHGRWFSISENASEQSVCSCNWGKGKLRTADLGAVRLYECRECGAKYTVFVDGAAAATVEINGINADDVATVGKAAIAKLWDRLYGFPGP